AAELFPTVIRSRAVSSRLAVGAIGSVTSTAAVSINWIGKSTPLLIFGIAAGVIGVLMLLLPETLNKPLPETMQDANDFGLESKPLFKSDTPVVNGRQSFSYTPEKY
ncbi:organic cation transporter protein-like protein, partial [Leptotrombidium deliense]